MSDPPEDDDGKRWDLPPEDQWVEVQFLGVAKLFCVHKISSLPGDNLQPGYCKPPLPGGE
jgi:hypothetical protein